MGDGDESKKQLGKIMLQRRLVTADELQEILDDQAKHPGNRLASTAARRGRVSMIDALRVLSDQVGVPGIDLTAQIVPLSLLKLIPQELAQEHTVLPLRLDGENLYMAMASPESAEVVEEVAFVTGKTILPHVALDYVMRQVIDYAYGAHARGEEFYVGAHVSDAQLAELGLPDLQRAPEPEGGRDEDAGEEPTADGRGELFGEGVEPRTPNEAPPLDDAFAERPMPSQPPVMAPPHAGARVLVADADPQSRGALAAVLRDVGISVLEAEEGVRALELIRDQTPDVLIVQAGLPAVHGFDICRRLKGSQRFGEIPIVVLSAELTDWRIELDLREVYGVRHLFTKPIDGPALLRAVHLLLDGKAVTEMPPPLSTAAEAHWTGAMEAFERGDLDDAIGQLERGAREEPKAFELHYHLGLLYGRRDDLFRAIESLTRAIAIQPHHFSALKNLAVVYQRAGFRRKALDVWQRAIGCAPDEDTRLSIKEHMVSLL